MIKELRAWRALPRATRYAVATHAARNETLPDPAVAAIALARARVRRGLWMLAGPGISVVAFCALWLQAPVADRAGEMWLSASIALLAGLIGFGVARSIALSSMGVEAAALRTRARTGDSRLLVDGGTVVLQRSGTDQGALRAAWRTLTADGFPTGVLLWLWALCSEVTFWTAHPRPIGAISTVAIALLPSIWAVTAFVRYRTHRAEPLLVLSPEGVQVPALALNAPWSAVGRADVFGSVSSVKLHLFLRSAKDFETLSTLPPARRKAAYAHILVNGGAITIPLAAFADMPEDVLRTCWTYRSPVLTA